MNNLAKKLGDQVREEKARSDASARMAQHFEDMHGSIDAERNQVWVWCAVVAVSALVLIGLAVKTYAGIQVAGEPRYEYAPTQH